MKLIINIILLPFIILLFLLKGLADLFRFSQSKYIPKIIEKLADEGGPFGTAVDELSFEEVLAYAKQRGALLSQRRDWFEFEINIDAASYYAAITRAPDSNRAIFRCRPASYGTTQSILQAPLEWKEPPNRTVERSSGVETNSSKEIAELASVVRNLNAVFDKHAEKTRW